MNNGKNKKILSVVIAIMLAFAITPCFGAGVYAQDSVSANQASGFVLNEKVQYTKSSDTTVYTKEFIAEEGNVFKLTKASASMSDSPAGIYGDSAPSVVLTDSQGSVVTAKSSGSEGYVWEFDKSGTYKLTVKCSLGSFYSDGIVLVYRIAGELAAGGSASGTFESMTVNMTEDSSVKLLTADIELGTYTGSDSSATILFRENLADGTMMCVEDYTYYNYLSDATIHYDGSYRFYAVKTNTFNSVLGEVVYEKGHESVMSDAQKAQLKEIAATAELNTPAPPVGSISNLTNKPTVKKAALKWSCGDTMYVTGYKIMKYNNAGKLLSTYYFKQKEAPTSPLTYQIAYEGKFKFVVMPYYEYDGKTFYGKGVSKVVSSAKIKPAAAGITKISNTKAKITIKKSEGSTGTVVYQKVGNKWKKIKTTTGTKVTWTKNKAGTAQYKFKSYIKDNGKTYYTGFSKIYKPAPNVKYFNLSSNAASYESLSHFWRPEKAYYKNGKVMLTGKFINTHIFRVDYIKVKVTLRCDNKVVGTTTISSGPVGSNCVKMHAAKSLGKKAGHDLANGKVTWSYNVIDWR